MWIFTPHGFISVVADKDNPKSERVLVRARAKHHLVNLFPECEPFEKIGSDYAWRAWIDRREVSGLMDDLIQGLAYPNFKNEIKDPAYHDACLDVWQAMYGYQLWESRKPSRNPRRARR